MIFKDDSFYKIPTGKIMGKLRQFYKVPWQIVKGKILNIAGTYRVPNYRHMKGGANEN